MWDRIWIGGFPGVRPTAAPRKLAPQRIRRHLLVEVLEGRPLLSASLGPLSNISVPAQLGAQVALDGSGNTDNTQTYTVTSDNPRIAASIAHGPFWTLNVQHNASSQPGDISFSGALTFQLFSDLTPNTVAQISNFTNSGWYNGKDFTRIAPNFPGPTDFVAQGGAANPDGTGTTPFPNFADEFVQSLTFTGTNQLAMANAGPNTNNTQFFVTTGTPTFLDFKHTVFGQLVSGQTILSDMTKVSVTTNSALGGENSLPVSPIVINSAVLSTSNVNGVIHLDATSAHSGDTANISVTATDPKDGTTKTETFKVTVGAYNGPTTNATVPINFVPFANPVTSSTQVNNPVTVQLAGKSGFPDATTPGTLTYKLLSQPAHGTISGFNASNGTLTYKPNNNFFGADSFQYQVLASGPQSGPNNIPSLPATVSVTIGAVNTGAVRQINDVLIITPPPRTDHGKDNIHITQVADSTVAGGEKIVVLLNGVPDLIQPPSSSLTQIIAFGTKASINILVDSNVDVPATLDGGHGGNNVINAGGGPSRLHGWFGHALLVGGTGPNALVGRKGVVRFKPSSTTTEIFAGVPKPRNLHLRYRSVPPGGTFYRVVKGRLVPLKNF
jgi:cyclophilin family peptidyl-prolyl cis-trans isomerase